ncbi:MAG: bactofilin family protein [Parashewanella sp.]
MFGKKSSAELTYIAPGTKISGDTSFSGDTLIGGSVTGNVLSNGTITIEADGKIDGEVKCEEINISGHFNGLLSCQKVTITASGIFEGEVHSNSIEIFDGGQFIGTRLNDQSSPKTEPQQEQLEDVIPLGFEEVPKL